jgi:hypothetical protein
VKPSVKVAIGVGVVAVVPALCAGLAPYYSTLVWWELRKTLPWLVMFLLGAGAIGAALWTAAWLYDKYDRIVTGLLLAVGGVLIGGFLTVLWMVHTDYSQARAYAASVHIVNDPVPQLAPRAPYQVGQAQARPNLGDIPGDIADTTYLPGQDRYATLVNRRGSLSGYEVAFTQQIPLQGRGTADQKCRFSPRADARLGGNFSHNLGRLIAEKRQWVRFSNDDAYAYCDGDTPYVVVPLKKQVGIWVVTERSAGVAVYNGRTGKVDILDSGAGIPGPSYPLSLAAKQRESTWATGSFGDYWFNRVGWETPDDDVNSGNDTEFILSHGGAPTYITPLTGRGSATAISVVTEVPATGRSGGLAPLYVHKLDPVWVSPKALVDRIKADYQDLPNWQNIQVYEVIPTGGDAWVATLGTGQNILYRVTGTGTLRGDNPTCLQRADGTTVRCGSVADRAGNGPGTQYGTNPGQTGAGTGAGSGDLHSLSDAQLADLQRRVADEVGCRLRKAC